MKPKKYVFVAFLGIALIGCKVEKKESGELPELDVDVTAEAGELPEYEVDWANVDVGTTTKTVEIPKVVIIMEEEEVEVPYIDINMPDGTEREERTIMVEAEVVDNEHDLTIEEIWVKDGKLWVISKLEATEQTIGKQKMRVSDQVTINAPDMDEKYIIVGERPDGLFNQRYRYVENMDALSKERDNVKVIYSK
nr:hypothetical protein [uncultured Allomuricauda sp.]